MTDEPDGPDFIATPLRRHLSGSRGTPRRAHLLRRRSLHARPRAASLLVHRRSAIPLDKSAAAPQFAVTAQAFVPGQPALLATADQVGWLKLWDLAGRDARCMATAGLHERAINAVALNAGGDALLTGSDERIAVLWDMERLGAGAERAACMRGRFAAHDTFVVGADTGGALFATASLDRRACLWHPNTPNPVAVLDAEGGAHAIRFVPGDDHAVLTGSGVGAVLVWDLRKTETYVRALGTGRDGPAPPGVAPDAAGLAPTRRLFDANRKRKKIWSTDLRRNIAPFRGHGSSTAVSGLQVDRLGRHVLSTGQGDAHLLWDLATGAGLRVFGSRDTDPSCPAVLTHDDGLVLGGTTRGDVHVWPTFAADPVASVLQRSQVAVSTIAINDDDTMLATGDFSGSVVVYSACGVHQPE